MSIKVDIVVGAIGGRGGGAPLAKIENLARGLNSRGVEVRVLAFKSKDSSDKGFSYPVKFLGHSTGSSVLDSIMLLMKAPFNRPRNNSVLHTFRIIRALPFLWWDPITCEVGAQETEVMKMRHSRVLIAIYNLIEKICLTRIKRVVVTDAETGRYLQAKHDIPDEKIEIIPVGTDLSVFNPDVESVRLSRYGIPDGVPLLLSVGRLEPVKNLPLMLNAFVKVLDIYPDSRLVIIGDGIDKEKLERESEELGLKEKVKFLGFVDHGEIPAFMTAADVFLQSSIREGSSNVIREAIACGLPVVSTDTGDVKMYVENGRNGYVVVHDASALADAIWKAIRGKDEFRAECLKMRESLSVEEMTRKYEDLFSRVYEKKLT